MTSHFDTAAWIGYVSTLGIVLAAPGTSVSLVVSQTLKLGRRGGFWTVAGDLTANAVQILAVSVAATAILAAVSDHRLQLKWGVVSYLSVTGLNQVKAAAVSRNQTRRSTSRAFGTGFLVSLMNPSALLFFALLLPSYVSCTESVVPQFALLGVVALILDCVILLTYMALAAKIRGSFQRLVSTKTVARIAGGMRIVSAVALVLAI